MSDVVDFAGEKAARAAMADLEGTARDHIRDCVAMIAEMHGGKPDDWIEAKVAACTDVIMGIARGGPALSVKIPGSLSPEDVDAVKASMAAWARDNNERCLHLFAERIVPLLGP